MNNKKKLAIASISLAGVATLGLGAFAFLSDQATTAFNALTGRVSIAVDGNIKHFSSGTEADQEGIDNINPGDNDADLVGMSNIRLGSDHEIEINVKNTGNKSIITRNVISIRVLDGETPIYHKWTDNGKDMSAILIHGDTRTDGDKLGMSKNHQVPNANSTAWWQNSEYDEATQTLKIWTKPVVLNGIGDNAEKESGGELPTTGTNKDHSDKYYMYDIGMMKEVGQFKEDSAGNITNDMATKLNNLAGKKVEVTVEVEAMQYRNTSNEDFKTIFSQKF